MKDFDGPSSEPLKPKYLQIKTKENSPGRLTESHIHLSKDSTNFVVTGSSSQLSDLGLPDGMVLLLKRRQTNHSRGSFTGQKHLQIPGKVQESSSKTNKKNSSTGAQINEETSCSGVVSSATISERRVSRVENPSLSARVQLRCDDTYSESVPTSSPIKEPTGLAFLSGRQLRSASINYALVRDHPNRVSVHSLPSHLPTLNELVLEKELQLALAQQLGINPEGFRLCRVTPDNSDDNLAVYHPSKEELDFDDMERLILKSFNYVFTLVFTIEMALKVIAHGFFIGKQCYVRSGWNMMDGFLVFISLVDLFTTMIGSSHKIFGILRVFRLLRTLKPLRVISRAPGLKLVVQTLLSSLRPIGNIVLICCTFFIIFGILGVQLFKGKFYYCEGPKLENVTNKTDCEKYEENKWVNQNYNFDHLGHALISLFVLASKDGWVNIMYHGIDAVEVDKQVRLVFSNKQQFLQPMRNNNELSMVYFISFLLLVGFFVLNMFVGVVVENFHKCRENQEKEEKARRALKQAKRLEKKCKSSSIHSLNFKLELEHKMHFFMPCMRLELACTWF
ncbi:hypothetical protein Ciccas_001019 [Cichlidogyrus casuarinus]|uniref:Ion transport domain-containing protein n=1 Tax=Cichlidogyrus casuarinus TaxID=1844966 RepID=A0ABD2QLA8_9PLAT